MNWIAPILTLASVILLGRKDRVGWLVGLAGNVLWLAAYGPAGDWSVVSVNVAFLGLNAHGWWQWRQR